MLRCDSRIVTYHPIFEARIVRRSIATVSLSGTLREKLEAIAAARFDGVEVFENDFIYFNGSAAEVRSIASDLGLSIDLYQPLRDFEGVPDSIYRQNLERAERKFDVMQAMGAPLALVCSNTSSAVIADDERASASSMNSPSVPPGAICASATKRSLGAGR
jgi:4-hydroxyphenylpyruvate dioxygenase